MEREDHSCCRAFACSSSTPHHRLKCDIGRAKEAWFSCSINSCIHASKHSHLPNSPATVSNLEIYFSSSTPSIFLSLSKLINLHAMFNSAHLYQQMYSQYPISMSYSYGGIPISKARVESFSGYPEKERDKRGLHHVFPRMIHQQASSKKKEEPIDGRYFHTQMGYVPVQIVDADKLWRGQEDREDRPREERHRREGSEGVTTLRQTWEATDKFAYSSNSCQQCDRHAHSHRRNTRVYQADPRESNTPPPPPHISNKHFVRKQERVSRVKKYDEVYRWSRPNEYHLGKGIH